MKKKNRAKKLIEKREKRKKTQNQNTREFIILIDAFNGICITMNLSKFLYKTVCSCQEAFYQPFIETIIIQ